MKKGIKNTETTKKGTSKPISKRAEAKAIPYGWISVLLFGAFVWAFLTFGYGDYMMKVESLSLWLPTKMYFDECMSVPGGFLIWVSCYLIQYLHIPWLGALIFALLLMGVQISAVKALRISKTWTSAIVIIPALLLLAFTNLGYLIFTLRPAGFALTHILGTLISLLLLWGCRKLKSWWLLCCAIALIVCLGYPLLGFYALFSGLLCATVGSKSSKSLPYIVAVLAIAIVPRLWYAHDWSRLMPSQIYSSPLPQFYSGEVMIQLVYYSVFAILILLAIVPRKFNLSEHINVRISAAIWLLTVILTGSVFAYRDANFRTTLALDRALWNQDWTQAVKIAEKMPENPTRLNTVLADIALMRTSEAGNRLFSIRYGWEPYNTTRDSRTIHDAGGALISYHLGLVNYAYRWAMEYSIAQCMSVERLKMLAKCALLNYELPLAKTYLEILYNMPMHRDWAKKYLRYQAHPLEMNSDPELVAIKQLMCHSNEFVNDYGAFETYIWPKLSDPTTIGTPQYNELGMQASLINRDLDSFMQRLGNYMPAGGRVPRYYQEAALLWSLLGKQPCPIPIDPQIEARHTQFLNTFRNTSNLEAEAQRDAMRESFGDTYWYYFVFTENMNGI